MSGMCQSGLTEGNFHRTNKPGPRQLLQVLGRAGFKIYYLAHHGSVGYFLDRETFRREEWTLAALTDQSPPLSL